MFALALALCFAADEKPALPAAWHGDWRGTLAITAATGKFTEVPMGLKIEPLEAARGYKWAITYGAGAKAQVRDYKLVPDGDKPGRFKIDERNGIVLSARLVGDTVFSTFEVEGALLSARYELRGDALLFEIVSNKKGEKTGDGKVQDFTAEVVQRAELKKAK